MRRRFKAVIRLLVVGPAAVAALAATAALASGWGGAEAARQTGGEEDDQLAQAQNPTDPGQNVPANTQSPVPNPKIRNDPIGHGRFGARRGGDIRTQKGVDLAAAAPAPGLPVRSITLTDATSDCIGDPKTPLCAVETFLACGVRRDMSLCRKVGIDNFSFAVGKTAIEFVLVLQKTIREEDIPDHLRDTFWYKPGNVDIYLFERDCPPGEIRCQRDPWWPYSYIARLVDSQWRIVTWTIEIPYEPDNEEN